VRRAGRRSRRGAACGWAKIARAVGIDRRVRYVEFRSFDANYWSSWDLCSALHPQTLLAYGMNGHDLHPNRWDHRQAENNFRVRRASSSGHLIPPMAKTKRITHAGRFI
jgi:hypothetical protein